MFFFEIKGVSSLIWSRASFQGRTITKASIISSKKTRAFKFVFNTLSTDTRAVVLIGLQTGDHTFIYYNLAVSVFFSFWWPLFEKWKQETDGSCSSVSLFLLLWSELECLTIVFIKCSINWWRGNVLCADRRENKTQINIKKQNKPRFSLSQMDFNSYKLVNCKENKHSNLLLLK